MATNEATRGKSRAWLRISIARIAHLALRIWPERHRQRAQLLELAPERFRDIGISRAAAIREAAKPFWR